MIGKTNVGGGGSSFAAYIQVATDPNAVITAVNLAGDTYSGTANSSGSLTLTVRKPGTYTVTETDGGVGTIVVADDGYTYVVEVNAFDGNIITEGVPDVVMSAEAHQTGQLTPVAPTITPNITIAGHTAIQVSVSNNSSGIYVTADAYDISDYTELIYYCGTSGTSTGSPAICAVDENGNYEFLSYVVASSERIISITSLDNTKKWRFGVMVYTTASGTVSLYVVNLKLQ